MPGSEWYTPIVCIPILDELKATGKENTVLDCVTPRSYDNANCLFVQGWSAMCSSFASEGKKPSSLDHRDPYKELMAFREEGASYRQEEGSYRNCARGWEVHQQVVRG